jgi:hypothetical protein
LESRVIVAARAGQGATFNDIPCKFPCYQGIRIGDWFDADCIRHHLEFLPLTSFIFFP